MSLSKNIKITNLKVHLLCVTVHAVFCLFYRVILRSAELTCEWWINKGAIPYFCALNHSWVIWHEGCHLLRAQRSSEGKLVIQLLLIFSFLLQNIRLTSNAKIYFEVCKIHDLFLYCHRNIINFIIYFWAMIRKFKYN